MFEMVEFLIENGGKYYGNAMDYCDITYSLLRAICNGYTGVCRVLLENEPNLDMNIQDEDDGSTLIHCAVAHGHPQILKMLLDYETTSNRNILNIYGNTVFEESIRQNYEFRNYGKLMMYQKHISNH